MKRIERVSLIGLGAMGVFFAPRLYRLLGEHFTVIAEGERKRRLETKGVTVNGVNYRFPIVTPDQSNTPADLILVCVKYHQLEQAVQDIRGQVGPDTIILSILNGIDSEDYFIREYGESHVLYSFMRMSIVMEDGVADFDPYWGKLHFGEKKNDVKNGRLSERVLAVKELMERADIPYQIEEDMLHGIWFKYMCNIGENQTCALLGVPFGAFHSNAHANAIRVGAMREVVAVANRLGVAIGEAEIERQERTIPTIPAPNKPSTLQDLEAGRKTEIEMLAGTVLRLGREYGVPTPINEMFYHGIRVLEEKNMRTEK